MSLYPPMLEYILNFVPMKLKRNPVHSCMLPYYKIQTHFDIAVSDFLYYLPLKAFQYSSVIPCQK